MFHIERFFNTCSVTKETLDKLAECSSGLHCYKVHETKCFLALEFVLLYPPILVILVA